MVAELLVSKTIENKCVGTQNYPYQYAVVTVHCLFKRVNGYYKTIFKNHDGKT